MLDLLSSINQFRDFPLLLFHNFTSRFLLLQVLSQSFKLADFLNMLVQFLNSLLRLFHSDYTFLRLVIPERN